MAYAVVCLFLGFLVLGLSGAMVNLFPGYHLHFSLSYLTGTMVVGSVAAFIALKIGLRGHSIIILRYSYDLSAKREDLEEKVALLAGGAILGVVLTLLTEFLKHKFWP
jgi:hypothetical protein